MSSRAWTEVAIGTEARSSRRWMRRVGFAVLVRWAVLLVLVVAAALIFGEVWHAMSGTGGKTDCVVALDGTVNCVEPPARIGDVLP